MRLTEAMKKNLAEGPTIAPGAITEERHFLHLPTCTSPAGDGRVVDYQIEALAEENRQLRLARKDQEARVRALEEALWPFAELVVACIHSNPTYSRATLEIISTRISLRPCLRALDLLPKLAADTLKPAPGSCGR